MPIDAMTRVWPLSPTGEGPKIPGERRRNWQSKFRKRRVWNADQIQSQNQFENVYRGG